MEFKKKTNNFVPADCLQGHVQMDSVPSLEILCCLQLWILPPVVEFIFLYVIRTMKQRWGQDCGYSEDNGGSALLNPKALQHIRFIERMLWSWGSSKTFRGCPSTVAVLCSEGTKLQDGKAIKKEGQSGHYSSACPAWFCINWTKKK